MEISHHPLLTTNESYLTTPLIIQLVLNYFTIKCGWGQIFLSNRIEDCVHTKGSVLPLLSQPYTTFEIKKLLLNQINKFYILNKLRHSYDQFAAIVSFHLCEKKFLIISFLD